MGNLSSCLKTKNSSKAKLVDSQGKIRLVKPTTVAEVLFKNPGFALATVEQLRRNRRILAMRANDVLLGRQVYLLVPVGRVNSTLSNLQLAAIDEIMVRCYCDDMGGRRTRGGSKVSPASWSTGLAGQITDVTGRRERSCKGWKPVLETIVEEY